MATTSDVRCLSCGAGGVRVDENGDCEQCWIDRGSAFQIFDYLEWLVQEALETGCLTGAQLQGALAMSLDNSEGVLPGTGWRREAVDTDERGVWYLPESLFDEHEDDPDRRSRIGRLRRRSGLSLEALAGRIGVSVDELALWEQDVLPPEDAMGALCEFFGMSAEFLLGTEVA